MIESQETDNELVRSDNLKCITLADAVRLTDRRRWTVHGDHAHSHPSSAHRVTPQRRLAQVTASAETGTASLCRAVGWRHGVARRRPCPSCLDPAVCDRARRRGAGCFREVGTTPTARARADSGAHLARRLAAGAGHLAWQLSGLPVGAPRGSLASADAEPYGCGGGSVGDLRPARRWAEGPGAGSAFARRCVPAMPIRRFRSHHWRYLT